MIRLKREPLRVDATVWRMLTLITWRPGMAIDNGLIDDDHRHLVDIVNSFRSHDERGRPALSQGLDSLYALKFYAQTHFEREEHLQCLVNFHQHREQEAEHRELANALDNLIWRAERAMTDGDAGAIVEELAHLLRRWVVNHIIGHDLQMKPYAVALRRYERELPTIRAVRRFGGPLNDA